MAGFILPGPPAPFAAGTGPGFANECVDGNAPRNMSAYHISIPHLYILEDLYTEQLVA